MMKRLKKQKSVITSVVLAFALVLVTSSAVRAELVLHYNFEEDDANKTAGNVIDQSTSHNDGTVETGWPAYDLPTYITSHDDSNAMLFGYDDVQGEGYAWNNVQTPKSDSLKNIGLRWTMAFWVRCDSTAGSYELLTHYPKIISCPNYEIILHSSTDSDSASYFWPWDEVGEPEQNWNFAMANTGSYEDQWIHMAVTYDGSIFKQYINGSVVFTKNDFSHQFDPTTWDKSGMYWLNNPLRIAASSDGNSATNGYLVGALDDVAIWNECLNVNQVAEVMDGNFAGPWLPTQAITVESDLPITFLWDPSFIANYGSVILGYGEKRGGAAGIPSWNWAVEGLLTNSSWYGLVNASLVDANSSSIEYAAYTTVGDIIAQPKPGEYKSHRRIHKNTKYDLRARVAGENAIGNIIGVKFYSVDVNNANDKILLADVNQTIAENQVWYDVAATFTADANYPINRTFRSECYINQAGGGARGSAFGWFDFVRIDVNDFYTCEAYYFYNFGINPQLSADFIEDCKIDFKDFASLAQDWQNNSDPEPAINTGELLVNSDFYQDIGRVPNNLDFDSGPPTAWQFVPTTTDTNIAGIQNLDRNGFVNGTYQPAGGSVIAYIDANAPVLQQTITSETIVNGQTYYFSAMVGGNPTGTQTPYGSMIRGRLEYVTNPTDTTGTQVAEANFIAPDNLVWRVITAQYTASAAAAGKYLRVKFDYGPVIILGQPFGGQGYGAVGKASVSKTKPPVWPRPNLLVNGNFENYLAIPMGTNNNDGYLDLFNYSGHWYSGTIPGWTANPTGSIGLQCMLWAPPGQPAEGRICAWFGKRIGQKVESEHIQLGTYYLDYIGCINAAGYDNGTELWPTDPNYDPNLVVNVYWLKDGINDPYGLNPPPFTNYGLITSLQYKLSGPLKGSFTYSVPYGDWAMPQMSFDVNSTIAGTGNRHFFVNVYEDHYALGGPGQQPRCWYSTFEEVFLSKQPRLDVGAYTCYELKNKYGATAAAADLNDDCNINFKDVRIFVEQWLQCNDPAGCP